MAPDAPMGGLKDAPELVDIMTIEVGNTLRMRSRTRRTLRPPTLKGHGNQRSKDLVRRMAKVNNRVGREVYAEIRPQLASHFSERLHEQPDRPRDSSKASSTPTADDLLNAGHKSWRDR